MNSNQYTSGESVKRDKALQVFMLLQDNPKMTQAKACADVGIDPKTYRKWIATHDEVLQKFEKVREEVERQEYAEILSKKSAVTENFIQQAMKPGVSISDRIKALEYIDKRIEELSSRYHVIDIEAEQDILSGPNQEKGISRMANRSIVKDEGNGAAI